MSGHEAAQKGAHTSDTQPPQPLAMHICEYPAAAAHLAAIPIGHTPRHTRACVPTPSSGYNTHPHTHHISIHMCKPPARPVSLPRTARLISGRWPLCGLQNSQSAGSPTPLLPLHFWDSERGPRMPGKELLSLRPELASSLCLTCHHGGPTKVSSLQGS